MKKLFTILFLILAFQIVSKAQITVSSTASNYDTIFGGTSIYYQYAWDDPLDDDNTEIFKLIKPVKAFEIVWDSVIVLDGSLMFITSEDHHKYLQVNGIGWDIKDKGYENDSIGLNNISPVKISDSMDRIEWRSFGFHNEWESDSSTHPMPSTGSVQLKINDMNTVDIIFGDFAIVHPDLCFEGFGSIRPSVSFYDGDSLYIWFLYGHPESPTIGTRNDTAFDHLPVLGQKVTLDFNNTNFTKRVSKLKIKISPNPVANLISINSAKDFTGSSFQIISMDGRTIHKGKLGSNQLNVEVLKTGNYILKIENSNQVFISRFVKD